MVSRASSLIFLLLAVPLGACGSDAGNGAQQVGTNPQDTAAAQPVREEHRNLELTPAWLAGRWQTEGGACGAGDTFLRFDPNGSYAFMAEQGRWSLTGDRLSIEVTAAAEGEGPRPGDRHTTIVRPIGPNEAEFRTEGAEPIRVFRCHEG